MDQERAADILEEMTPGAAADALEDLEDDVAEQLLARMEPEEAADVQTLLSYDEDSAGRIMSTDCVRISADATVGAALAAIRALEEVPDPLLAVYAMAPGDPDRLQGIVRLQEKIAGEDLAARYGRRRRRADLPAAALTRDLVPPGVIDPGTR